MSRFEVDPVLKFNWKLHPLIEWSMLVFKNYSYIILISYKNWVLLMSVDDTTNKFSTTMALTLTE
jgi:hypothetical protein